MKKKLFLILMMLCLAIMISLSLLFFKIKFSGEIKKDNIEKFNLPLLSADLGDKKINTMYPYNDNISSDICYDTLNILPKDRKIKFNIINNKRRIEKISYEIRDYNKELIENTNLSYDNSKYEFDIVLPIENLILDNKEYILKIKLEFKLNENENTVLCYYSRLRGYDGGLCNEMIDLAKSFSKRNFDYDSAAQNAPYLETDGSEFMPNLADVSLKSSFKMLTYNGMDLSLKDNSDVRLISYDNNIGRIKINSIASRTNRNNEIENYEIEEDFTFRKGEERLYMLDYHRKMNEIFEAEKYNFTGKRLVLGVSTDDDIASLMSADKRYIAFSACRDLFLFDNTKNELKKIYYDNELESAILRYRKNGIKILDFKDNKLRFLSYGYQKDRAELGINIYEYNIIENKLHKLAFIETNTSFEELNLDIKKLSYINKADILYIKRDDDIYSVNLKTGQGKLEKGDLSKYGYAISKNESNIAYLDEENILYFMNLDTNKIVKKQFSSKFKLSIVDFVDTDIVIAVADKNENFKVNGYECEPKNKSLQILNSNFDILKEYASENKYIDNIYIASSVIKFDILEKNSNTSYRYYSNDSIVLNSDRFKKDSVGYYANDKKTRIYYIQPDKAYESKKVSISDVKIDKKVGKNNTDIKLSEQSKQDRFFIYIRGELVAIDRNLTNAIKIANTNKGYINFNSMEIYSKISTKIRAKNELTKETINTLLKYKNENMLVEISGIELADLLYYISRGQNLMAYNSSGELLIIYSYDKYNINVYNISTGQMYKIDRGLASQDFELSNNTFYTSIDFN